MNDYELYHYGVKGMKWGVRKKKEVSPSRSYDRRVARGYAGPGRYIGDKRKLDGYKRDLDYLDRGGHLSIGLTKKRQEAFDKKDRERLTKKIGELEAKDLKKRQDAYDANINMNWYKAYNKACDKVEKDILPKLNEEWKSSPDFTSNMRSKAWKEYEARVNKAYDDMFEMTLTEMFGKRPE